MLILYLRNVWNWSVSFIFDDYKESKTGLCPYRNAIDSVDQVLKSRETRIRLLSTLDPRRYISSSWNNMNVISSRREEKRERKRERFFLSRIKRFSGDSCRLSAFSINCTHYVEPPQYPRVRFAFIAIIERIDFPRLFSFWIFFSFFF